MDTDWREGSSRLGEFCIHRQKGGAKMNWFYNTVAAVKEHGNAWGIRFDILGFVVCVVLFLVFKESLCLSLALLFFLFLMWEIDDALNRKEITELTRLLIDRNDEVINLKRELVKRDDEIAILKATTTVRKDNPIKSNRIVADKTFAIRFKWFVEEVRCSDPMSEEEADYLIAVAERLLKWQTKTVRKDSEEYKYLERLGLMPHPSANTEEHTEETPKPKQQKPKVKPVRKPKNTEAETAEDENKN